MFILATFFPFVYAFGVAGTKASLESRASMDVYSPPILYPNAATIWLAGQQTNVTWDASNPPKTISNTAAIVLKTAGPSDWIPFMLASDFSLLDGRHMITVPTNATTRNDWQIVLFGDSGNVSPTFTILF